MSQTEENQTPSKQPEATNDPVAEFADDLHIVDAMKPTAAPTSDNKPLRYGTRKKKAGESGPNIKDLSSVSSFEEEEEIEMDDLPIRATAPEELIDTRPAPSEPREEYGERRPRRNDRSRGERRERKPRERAPRKDADQPSAESETNTEAAPQQEADRPERFGTVKPSPAAKAEVTVDEFRPSRDGRSNAKRERKPRDASESRSKAPAKKKGLLAKIVSFFAGGDKEEEKKQEERSNRSGDRQRGGRGRRGPNNRQNRDENREGGEGGGQRRRRRPRNRKPRPDGEGGERRERQNREGGENRRPRRPRRPRREGGKPGDADAREIGRRAREESEASKK
ncbi:hypothetical protein [Pelagicoccus sp. SDUM812005]|uniref:hypothetical protein n=1 Tax=Pelagicoccus sp. SDUM812005 TaxID=3041257 RepID=UPI00280E08F1|nr:hypothetical protein [Pelagicoccus sp. SDUM812005]MDQ8183013.1 hypothetical protein [Pelagicoccus sp. SDUM812005]